jgi:glycosyltransferase involved in cell wall biosynthesis
MKIAIAVNHFAPFVGGCEVVCGEIASYLSRSHNVAVITRQTAKRQGLKFPYTVLEYSPTSLRTFLSALDHAKPDVLFVYSDVFDFLPNALAYKSKIIFAPVGGNRLQSDTTKANLFYRSLGNIDLIICHSRYIDDYRLCQTDKAASKTVVVSNGVHVQEFNLQSKRESFGHWIVDRKWILNVSNFFPGKNQSEIINILSRLPNPASYAYFQVAADIEFTIGQTLEARWRVMSQRLKQKGMEVQLVKNADRQKIVDLFRLSNAFIFTSIKEVTPIVLLESMAAGLPWVSTDVGDTPDFKGGLVIKTAKNSMGQCLFDESARTRFAEGLQTVLQNQSMGDLGQVQATEEYDWKMILPRYERLFETVYGQG